MSEGRVGVSPRGSWCAAGREGGAAQPSHPPVSPLPVPRRWGAPVSQLKDRRDFTNHSRLPQMVNIFIWSFRVPRGSGWRPALGGSSLWGPRGGLHCVRAWVRGRVVLLPMLGGAGPSGGSQCLSLQAGFRVSCCSESSLR